MARSPSTRANSPDVKRKRGAASQGGPNKRRKANVKAESPVERATSEAPSAAASAPSAPVNEEAEEFGEDANDEDDLINNTNAEAEQERNELREGLACGSRSMI